MANFIVVKRDTEEEISIRVGTFIIRDNFESDGKGNITIFNPNGWTYVMSMGDSIEDKLGLDNLIQGSEWYFKNHPEYYLKLSSTTPTTRTDIRYIDGSALPNENECYKIIQEYYSYIGIYKNNSVLIYLCPVYKYSVVNYLNNTPIDKTYVAIGSNALEPLYKSTLIFSFSQKLLFLYSPYYYQYPTYSSPTVDISTGNIYRNLYAEPIKNYANIAFRNAPPSSAVNQSVYFYNTDPPQFLTYGTNIKTFGDVSGRKVVSTVSSNYNSTGTYVRPTLNFRSLNYQNIEGMTQYDFMYYLLFDTESEEKPYPDNNGDGDNSGQSKPTTGGKPTGGDKNSDEILLPPIPSVNPISTGSVNLYQMSTGTFRQFMAYLWTNPFYTAIIKLFTDPMQCVISTHLLGVSVPTSRSGDIIIGNVNTNITANIVDNNFMTISFGSITIDEYYGDANDYDTIIEIYLPYYGSATLNTQEVMNSTLTLSYMIDVLTGTFVAFINVSKNIDGTSLNSILYQYNGNMAYQVPLSGADYSSFISTALSLTASAITKTPTPQTDGTTLNSGQANIKIGYERSGNLSANTGYMGIKTAYVTILRPIHSLPPNFSKYMGFPYEGYINLGSCNGLTICREVFIDNVIGSVDETEEIKRLLKEGVIF